MNDEERMNLFDCSLPFKYRETCKHWIDYEIFDSLPQYLKRKYIDQFRMPRLVFTPTQDRYTPKIYCQANHKDSFNICTVNCSEYYSETLKQLENMFHLTHCYENKILIDERK